MVRQLNDRLRQRAASRAGSDPAHRDGDRPPASRTRVARSRHGPTRPTTSWARATCGRSSRSCGRPAPESGRDQRESGMTPTERVIAVGPSILVNCRVISVAARTQVSANRPGRPLRTAVSAPPAFVDSHPDASAGLRHPASDSRSLRRSTSRPFAWHRRRSRYARPEPSPGASARRNDATDAEPTHDRRGDLPARRARRRPAARRRRAARRSQALVRRT
jgi:hypothetical protein